MKFSSSGDTLANSVQEMVGRAKRVTFTTVAGDKFDAYEPISLGRDFAAFSTSLRADDTVTIRRGRRVDTERGARGGPSG